MLWSGMYLVHDFNVQHCLSMHAKVHGDNGIRTLREADKCLVCVPR